MKTLSKVVLVIFMLCHQLVKAQDMHFTQFYASGNSIYLNPAYTGADVCSRFALTYRNQWPGVSKAYKTFLASFDHYITDKNIGIGLVIGNDVAGTGQLRTTVINPLIAYEIKLTKRVFMRFGAQPGIGIRSVNYNNLMFGDQIARGGNVATIETPTQSKVFFDAGAGVLCYSRKFWAGVSVYHLNRPNTTLLGESGKSQLPIKYSAHGGYRFIINPDEKEVFKQRTFTPAINYRGQAKFDQIDVGAYYNQNVLSIGLWYRGIPVFKAYKKGYANNDALALIIGVKIDRLNFGYSYDMTISKLTPRTQGAHEITVGYQLCKLTKKKRKTIIVPCPKF